MFVKCVAVIALDKLISQRERKDNPGSCLQRWRGEGTHCTTGIKRVDFDRKYKMLINNIISKKGP